MFLSRLLFSRFWQVRRIISIVVRDFSNIKLADFCTKTRPFGISFSQRTLTSPSGCRFSSRASTKASPRIAKVASTFGFASFYFILERSTTMSVGSFLRITGPLTTGCGPSTTIRGADAVVCTGVGVSTTALTTASTALSYSFVCSRPIGVFDFLVGINVIPAAMAVSLLATL